MKSLFNRILLLAALLSVASFAWSQRRLLEANFDSGIGEQMSVSPQTAGADTWTASDGVARFIGKKIDGVSHLTSVPLDLTKVFEPQFYFYYRIEQYDAKTDSLAAFVRKDPQSEWVLVTAAVERSKVLKRFGMFIPDSLVSETTQISIAGINRGGGGIEVDSVVIHESNLCIEEPSVFVLNLITSEKAVFNWQTNSVAKHSRLIVSKTETEHPDRLPEAEILFDETIPADPIVNVATVTGLETSTAYFAYVQSDCDFGDRSRWAKLMFQTPCEAKPTSFADNFDSYTITTGMTCWQTSGNIPPSLDNKGSMAVLFNTGVDQYSYLFSPELATDEIQKLTVSFDIFVENIEPQTAIEIGVISNPYDLATFEALHTIRPTIAGEWESVKAMLGSYYGDENGDYGKYVAFRVGNAGDKVKLWIDNFGVTTETGIAPQQVTVDRIAAYSARVLWCEFGPGKEFTVRVSETELTADQLAQPSETDSIVETEYAKIEGLKPSTRYFVYVKSENNIWSEAYEFHTHIVWKAGFTDDLSAYTTLPDDWQYGYFYKDEAVNGINTAFVDLVTTGKTEDIKSLHMRQQTSQPFVIFPEMEAETMSQVQLRFEYKANIADDYFYVAVCDEPDITTATNVMKVIPEKANAYAQYLVTFEDYKGKGKFIAFVSDSKMKISTVPQRWFKNFAVETAQTCNKIEGVEVTNVRSTQAHISWAGSGVASRVYEVLYKTDKETEWQTKRVENACQCNLTDLASSAKYSVKVRGVCDETASPIVYSPESTVRTFSTGAAITIPYYEDFKTNPLGTNWAPGIWGKFGSSFNPEYYSMAWTVAPGETLQSGIQKGSLRMRSRSGYSYAVMPELPSGVNAKDLSMAFVLWSNNFTEILGKDTTNFNVIEIGVMTDRNDISTFEKVADATLDRILAPQNIAVTLDAYTGQGTYIAFRYFNEGYVDLSLYIDNLSIVALSECVRVPTIALDDANAADATVSWIKGNEETEWNVALFDHEVALDTIAKALADNLYTAGSTSSNPLKLENLDFATDYWLFIQSKTANCISDWSQPFTFRTACPEKWPTRYTETFNNVAPGTFPHCYLYKNHPYGSSHNPQITKATRQNPDCNRGTAGGNILRFQNSAMSSDYVYVILPVFDIDLTNTELTFYARKGNSIARYTGIVEVGVMDSIDESFLNPEANTSRGGIAANNDLFTAVQTVEAGNEWTPVNVYFPKYIRQGSRIAFRARRFTENNYIDIDSIMVNAVPQCAIVADITVQDVTTDAATFQWTVRGEKNWNVKVATKEIDPATVADDDLVYNQPVTDCPLAIGNLQPNTRYWIYVQRDNKEAGCQSVWSRGYMFTTECGVAPAGFSDDFESNRDSYGSGVEPRCWTLSGTSAEIACPAEVPAGVSADNKMCLKMMNSSSYDATSDRNTLYTSYASTPAIDTAGIHGLNDLQVSFRVYSKNFGSNSYGRFEVGVMTDPADPSTYRSVYSGYTRNDAWKEFTVHFRSYTNDDFGGRGNHITFRCLPGNVFGDEQKVASNVIYIDDVRVEPYDACSPISDYRLSGVTDSSVDLSWASSVADEWRVLISRSVAIDPESAVLDTIVKQNPTTIANLPANTRLYARVALTCDGAEWSNALAFRTSGCNNRLPYVENFDDMGNSSVVPPCYNAYHSDMGYGTAGSPALDEECIKKDLYGNCTQWQTLARTVHTDSRALVVGNGAYAILPEFAKYDLRKQAMSFTLNGTNDIQVGVIDNVFDVNTFTPLAIVTPSMTDVAMIDFGNYPAVSASSRIAIHCVDAGDAAKTVHIDNITVDASDALWAPAAVRADMVFSDYAVVSWRQFGNVDSWEVSAVARGGKPADGEITAASATQTAISGLTPNTAYDIYIRSVGNGKHSAWSASIGITTTPEAAKVPYNCDFENDTENAAWQFFAQSQADTAFINHWTIADGVKFEGNKALYVTADNASYGAYAKETSKMWAYRTIQVERAGYYNVSLWAQGVPFGNNIYLSVALMPSSVRPVPSSFYQIPAKDVNSGADYNPQNNNTNRIVAPAFSSTAWQEQTVRLYIDRPGVYNLMCFYMKWNTQDRLSPAIDNISIVEDPCWAPENPVVTAYTDRSVSIAWHGNPDIDFDVIVATEAADDPATLTAEQILYSGKVEKACEFTYTDNVKANTDYVFYVRQACDPTAAYVKVAQTTACTPVSVPVIESFSNTGLLSPDCWAYSDGTAVEVTADVHEASVAADTTVVFAAGKTLVMPLVAEDIAGLQMLFKVAHDTVSGATPTFEIGIMESVTDLSTYRRIEGFRTNGEYTNAADVQFTEFYHNFAGFAGNGRYIAFRAAEGTFFLDDLNIDRTPTCAQPYSLSVSNIGSEQVDLNWFAADGQTQWWVKVTDKPVAADDLNNAAAVFTDTATSTHITVSGLVGTTTYYAYVRSMCGNDGVWSLASRFTTSVLPQELPFVEKFDEVPEGALPGSWMRHNYNIANYYAGRPLGRIDVENEEYSAFAVGISGTPEQTAAFAVTSFHKAQGAAATYRWLVSPEIVIDEQALLSFDLKFVPTDGYYKASDVVRNGRKSRVRIFFTTDNGINWNDRNSIDISDAPKADYDIDNFLGAENRVYVDLARYTGKTVRFAIYVEALDATYLNAEFDNFYLRCADVHEIQDVAYENHDYQNHGFAFDYTEMVPGNKRATRYCRNTAEGVCDSIVNITLNVLPTIRVGLNDMKCPEDEFYEKNNFKCYETGEFVQRLTAVSGVDSIVTLTLGMNETGITEMTLAKCPGDTVEFVGKKYFKTGIYRDTLPDHYGCDSIFVLDLMIFEGDTTDIVDTITTDELPYMYKGVELISFGTDPQHIEKVVPMEIEGEECMAYLDVDILLLPTETGIEYSKANSLSVTPNPVKQGETISIGALSDITAGKKYTAVIYDAAGAVVRELCGTQTPLTVECNFAPGVYIVCITSNDEFYRSKFIVIE